jgi:hypothetical protein
VAGVVGRTSLDGQLGFGPPEAGEVVGGGSADDRVDEGAVVAGDESEGGAGDVREKQAVPERD